MAAAKPKQLDVPQLAAIKKTHPEIGKAIDAIIEYIRKNVTPVQGNRVER